MFEIFSSLNESDQNTDFVAIGNLVKDNGKNSYHAAFVINYEDKLSEFHYTGEKVEFIQIERDYYHKITETISPEEVPAFVALCRVLEKKAKPIYGYFYSGEFYDKEGTHQNNNEFGERMTCVGFCLNVFKTFLEDDYIRFSDWDGETDEWKEYLKSYCRDNNLDETKIKDSIRRITPRECMASCFFKKLPIIKSDIEGKIEYINNYFETRFAAINN